MKLDSSLGEVNCLVESNFRLITKDSTQPACWFKLDERITNVRDPRYVLAEGTTLGSCESVTSAVPVDSLDPQIPGTGGLG